VQAEADRSTLGDYTWAIVGQAAAAGTSAGRRPSKVQPSHVRERFSNAEHQMKEAIDFRFLFAFDGYLCHNLPDDVLTPATALFEHRALDRKYWKLGVKTADEVSSRS
jgi:hypothetical protein